MVFQGFNLFPHMTALENVIEAPIKVKKEAAPVATERGRALLDRVGLGTGWTPIPASSPAGSSSGWRSPGRWPCSPS